MAGVTFFAGCGAGVDSVASLVVGRPEVFTAERESSFVREVNFEGVVFVAAESEEESFESCEARGESSNILKVALVLF